MQVVSLTGRAAVVSLIRAGRQLIKRPCVGLGPDEKLVAATYDGSRSFRAYGVTQHNVLLGLLVPADKRTSYCKVYYRVSWQARGTAMGQGDTTCCTIVKAVVCWTENMTLTAVYIRLACLQCDVLTLAVCVVTCVCASQPWP